MKKIIKLLIGTNNKGKLKEIMDLLPKNLEIHYPSEFKIKSPAENGKTFEENSLIKARYFSKKSKMVCLSDDSGLEVDALGGAPGIYSARWGGKKGDFVKAMNKVFKELDKKDKKWRTKKIKARFVCALTIYEPNQKIINLKKFFNFFKCFKSMIHFVFFQRPHFAKSNFFTLRYKNRIITKPIFSFH